jgi:hypothetical protein
VRARLADLDASGTQERAAKPVSPYLRQLRHGRENLSGLDDDVLDAYGTCVGSGNVLAFLPTDG